MIRDYPYPARGAVTICSDVDGSPDLETYLEVVRFLNGTGPTALGKGLGLEIGNSFYFDNDHPSRFSYWSTSDEGRDVIRELIRSGHIDCLHSFGESSTSREQAILALDELQKHDCFLEVWVNHSKTPTNISSPSMPGQGDFPGDPAYHTDRSVALGFKYFWLGQITSIFGQDSRFCGRNVVDDRLVRLMGNPKQICKCVSAAASVRRYHMHFRNRVLTPLKMADGRMGYEFMRTNPHPLGIGRDGGNDLAGILSIRNLEQLIATGGAAIVYTHFLKGRKAGECLLNDDAVQALENLQAYANRKSLLVTTTRRLLSFLRARDGIGYDVRGAPENGLTISIARDDKQNPSLGKIPIRDLEGLTFYTDVPSRTNIQVDGRMVGELRLNDADETGRTSVSIPWTPLSFPIV